MLIREISDKVLAINWYKKKYEIPKKKYRLKSNKKYELSSYNSLEFSSKDSNMSSDESSKENRKCSLKKVLKEMQIKNS